jgi:hypothetical protein
LQNGIKIINKKMVARSRFELLSPGFFSLYRSRA